MPVYDSHLLPLETEDVFDEDGELVQGEGVKL